jgi:hypothetical protein
MYMEEFYDPAASPHYGIPREAKGLPCKCGGYAAEVAATARECEDYGCGRDRPGSQCCAAAFVCRLCRGRIFGHREAPEME